MLSHLAYTSSEYDQRPDSRKVHPISTIDADIIMQLIDLTTQAEIEPLLMILEQWKNMSDQKIFNLLKDLNQRVSEGESLTDDSKEKDKVKPLEFIEIQQESIRVKDIFRITKCERYVHSKQLYAIWINPVQEDFKVVGSLVTDALFYYSTPDERDQALSDLKQKLIDNKKCKFI